ncbi:hypothetical protein M9Y10_037179 [Tritrichomonas musculus]|uniref:Protein kinase domain-containing protein n=1 Tax=Tritrichomonas musculus TaxID=1915356 RepID=A0ABR2GT71_9EUKA
MSDLLDKKRFFKYFFDTNAYNKGDQIGDGTVFKFISKKDEDEIYAGKILQIDPKTFLKEIGTLLSVHCPSIVSIKGFSLSSVNGNSSIGFYPIIFLEYLANGTLLNLLYKKENETILTDTKKYIIILGLTLGMYRLHKKGIIHIYLKPDNIFLDGNYYPHIESVGTATNLPLNPQDCGITYAAPEAIEGCQPSFKMDVYSYSLILFEILTAKHGENPVYNGARPYEVRPKTSNLENNAQKELIEKCWSEDPDERPEFDEILRKIGEKGFYSNFDCKEVDEYLKLFPEEDIKILFNQAQETNSNQAQEANLNQAQETNLNQAQETNSNQAQEANLNQAQETNSNQAQEANLNQAQETNSNQAQEANLNQAQETNSNQAQEANLNQAQETNSNQAQEANLNRAQETNSNQAQEANLNQAQGTNSSQNQEAMSSASSNSSILVTDAFSSPSSTSGSHGGMGLTMNSNVEPDSRIDDLSVGIIEYLRNSSGNLKDLLTVESRDERSPEKSNKDPNNVIIYDDDESPLVYISGEDFPNNFILFSFQNNQIEASHYKIKTVNHPKDGYHLRSWIIRGSNDNNEWEEIDKQEDCDFLNGDSYSHIFEIKKEKRKKYRHFCLSMTGPNWFQRNILALRSFELYGKIY